MSGSPGDEGALFPNWFPCILSWLEHPLRVWESGNVFLFLFLFLLLFYRRVCNGCFLYLVKLCGEVPKETVNVFHLELKKKKVL